MGKSRGGIAGIWLDDHKCMEAAAKFRDAGYKKFDAITPFPVHGMEEAVGIKRSPIPYVAFVAGVVGGSLGLLLQYWTSAVSWATNIGGKPFFSAPAFIPVTFETTILLAALSSVGALFAMCRLPKIDPPIIDLDLTSHKFALWVPDCEPGYDPGKIEQLMKSLGAVEVKRMAEY